MTGEKLWAALGGVRDGYVTEAMEYQKRRPVWVRWAALAACLCLIAGLGLAAALVGGRYQSGPGPSNDLPVVPAVIEYDGCCYEAASLGRVLEKYGLPEQITADMAGEHVAFLELGGGGYLVTDARTDIELCRYAPSPCRGVYVLRDGEAYMAALFCNFLNPDDVALDLTELYQVYGVRSAGDIASITPVETAPRTPVKDREAVEAFYELTMALPAVSEDEFRTRTFGGIDENDAREIYDAFADDSITLRVETASGLRFFLNVYPSCGWLWASGAQTYYPLDAAALDWLERYL